MTQQSTQQSSKERREQWQSHIEGWQHSGKTRAAYCEQHGLSLQTFAYWRKRLKKSSGSVRLVQLPPGLLQQAGRAALRLVVDDRYTIEVGDGFSSATLQRVLAVVRGR